MEKRRFLRALSRQHFGRCLAIGSATFIATLACATEPIQPKPRVWTWGDLTSTNALNSTHVKQAVRLNEHGPVTDVEADVIASAKATVQEIYDLGLSDGEVCITHQNFGSRRFEDGTCAQTEDWVGPCVLWRNEDDSLTVTGDSTNYNMIPFFYNGVLESKEWMEAYLEALENELATSPLQGLPSIISRFHFDTEHTRVTPDFCKTPKAFDMVRLHDTRWDDTAADAQIYGWTDTLSDMYNDYRVEYSVPNGQLGYDPTKNWHHANNEDWSIWYAEVTYKAADASMKEAAYDPIQTYASTWEGVKSSNYGKSMKIDGSVGLYQQYLNTDIDFLQFPFLGSGEMQAIVNYPLSSSAAEYLVGAGDDDAQRDATIERGRSVTDLCIHSFSGGHSDEILIWMIPSGTGWNGVTWRKEDSRRQLTLYRGRDVHEFYLWWSGTWTSTDQDDFIDVISQVYLYDIDSTSVSVTKGVVQGGSDPADLEYALRDYYTARSAIDGGGSTGFQEFELEVEFESNVLQQSANHIIELYVEAGLNSSSLEPTANLGMLIWNDDTSEWDPMILLSADNELEEDVQKIYRAISDPDTADVYVDSSGVVKVRLYAMKENAQRFVVDIDAIQVAEGDEEAVPTFSGFPTDPCAYDSDDNGVVDFADYLILLSEWGPCESCDSDFDDSGAVDFQDLLAFSNQYGETCDP